METCPKIAFCGPIAAAGTPARGGYEAANRRTIDHLRAHGLSVLEFAYPVPEGSVMRKAAIYLAGFAQMISGLYRARADWDILHHTALHRQFLLPETVLRGLARLLGKPVLLDIRAGQFIAAYKARSSLYRKAVDRLLHSVDRVSVEGREYIDFVQARGVGDVFYFPNYVSVMAAGNTRVEPMPGDKISAPILVYTGRVVPAKGVDILLGALEILNSRGVRGRARIIGTGASDYIADLKDRYASLEIEWMGAVRPADVRRALQNAHFFVFPSRYPGEGHSNSLTEAMSEGVVPVCSDNGFNRTVIGGSGMVLEKTADPEDYANVISELLDKNEWLRLSRSTRQRVEENFSAEKLIPELIKVYSQFVSHESCFPEAQFQKDVGPP